MEYIKTIWHHKNEDYPILLFSELDTDRMEVRKMEFYKDGSFGFASNSIEYGGSFLGEAAVPSVEEINKDPQFSAQNISKQYFEKEWGKIFKISIINSSLSWSYLVV